MKQYFFSILVYGCTTWTLMEKKLDRNYTRERHSFEQILEVAAYKMAIYLPSHQSSKKSEQNMHWVLLEK